MIKRMLPSPKQLKKAASRQFHRVKNFSQEILIGEKFGPSYFRLRYPLLPRTRPLPSEVKQLVIWNIDSIGDSLFISPTLRAAKAIFPNAKITLVCNESVLSLWQYNPHIDRLVGVPPYSYYTGLGLFKPLRLPKDLQKPDLMLILEMGSRPADRGRILSRDLRSKYSVSSHVGLLKSLTDEVLAPNNGPERKYWPEYFLQALAGFQIEPKPHDSELEIFLSDADHATVREKLLKAQMHSSPYWVLHPKAAAYASRTKQWPITSFFEVTHTLLERYPQFSLCISGGKEDIESCAQLEGQLKKLYPTRVLNLAGQLNLRETASLLSKSKALLTLDTSVFHLGCAVRTQVVGLFGATDPKVLAPQAPNVRVVKTMNTLPCQPCHQTKDVFPFWPTCIYPEPKCLMELTSDQVLREMEQVLC